MVSSHRTPKLVLVAFLIFHTLWISSHAASHVTSDEQTALSALRNTWSLEQPPYNWPADTSTYCDSAPPLGVSCNAALRITSITYA